MSPGNSVRFKKISIEEAHQIYIEYEDRLNKIKLTIDDNRFEFKKIRKLNLKIDGISYGVDIKEIN